MEDRFRALLACPACGGALDASWCCGGCSLRYAAPDGVPALRLPGTMRTETVRAFYSAAPFPGYPPNDSLTWLGARAERSRFARLLDEAIPGDATIAEIGCGTGQMSLYLARADRIVIGADLTRASLLLGAAAAARFAVDKALFVETDLASSALRPAAFDVVYCSGVLHHTADPRESFRHIARLVRPGGMIIIGLYNSIARIPLRMRRAVARLTNERWIPRDPVLNDRAAEPARREAWLRDQYRHPEEHRHSLAEVRRWFAENGIEYVRAFPTALLTEESEDLFASETDGWWIEDWLAQVGWIGSLGGEGGLFVSVGRRTTDRCIRTEFAPGANVRTF
jgi:2-polyprenyl-3-methyl-5-hydroxy-6-metoxy-1,4-benzoquinol methylase